MPYDHDAALVEARERPVDQFVQVGDEAVNAHRTGRNRAAIGPAGAALVPIDNRKRIFESGVERPEECRL
jgi:hypothetical protein